MVYEYPWARTEHSCWLDYPCQSHTEEEVVGRAGKLPSLVDFIGSCKAKCKENPFGEVLMVAQSKPAESLVMGKPHMTNGNSRQGMKAGGGVARKWSDLLNKRAGGMPFNFVWERRRHRHVKAEKRSEVGVITGGASGAMNMLHVYMKALESTHSPHGG